MSHVPHDLASEFPEDVQRIHALKASDRHFARLVDEYHELNRAIHRLETRAEAGSEDRESEMRRRRLALKDQIAQLLAEPA